MKAKPLISKDTTHKKIRALKLEIFIEVGLDGKQKVDATLTHRVSKEQALDLLNSYLKNKTDA